MKKIMVLGGSGATGSLVVNRLLNSGFDVVLIVRSKSRLSNDVLERAEVIEGEISSYSDHQLESALQGCDACVSCLGHNITLSGMFGRPRYLVTEVIKKLIRVKKSTNLKPFKFVLMSSSGVQNQMIVEHPPLSQRLVVSMLRLLLPPHRDNEHAAAELMNNHKLHLSSLEWVVIRPDTLIDKPEVTPIQEYESPVRNVIFNAGHTSRVNVAEFMYRLLTEEALWTLWKFKMSVIYDVDGLE